MLKKLSKDEFERIIKPLPARERTAMRERELTPDWLKESMSRCRRLMKRDTWIGPIWVILYGIFLFRTGYSNLTIAIFVIGAVYFVYTIFTTGSYGLNRKRLKVYGALLEKMEN